MTGIPQSETAIGQVVCNCTGICRQTGKCPSAGLQTARVDPPFFDATVGVTVEWVVSRPGLTLPAVDEAQARDLAEKNGCTVWRSEVTRSPWEMA